MLYEKYDVIVIGGGHAGVEAALASARLGCKTLLITMNLDKIGFMSCNPSIGGIGKGHLVKEIDALGGEMGLAIDDTGIQFRKLNTRKGKAVTSTRAQADKLRYQLRIKWAVENCPNLQIRQGTVTKIITDGKWVKGVETDIKEVFYAKAVVLAPGTFLGGLIFIGDKSFPAGRLTEQPANLILESLKELGFQTGRFKTGTGPRLDGRTINFSVMDVIESDDPAPLFSFKNMNKKPKLPQVACYITYTTEETHRIIRENIHLSAMYSGRIKGKGVRYCPSLEDKVMKFPEKERHRIFLEPEGLDTFEIYVNGLGNSLPIDIQEKLVHSVPGLEKAEILRPGYAIEYEYVFPDQLNHTLETKIIRGLFLAGQINGTTGYEEAAGQGIIAGINAALLAKEEELLVIDRTQAYIGVMIDDLVTKGTDEAYRIFTSRAEYRLLLRENNADLRLTEIGKKIGLVDDERWEIFQNRKVKIERLLALVKKLKVYPGDINGYLERVGTSPIREATRLVELIKRPEVNLRDLKIIIDELSNFSDDIIDEVETEIKYEGYIERQLREVEQFRKLESLKLPDDINYWEVEGLSTELKEKLSRIKPKSIGQAMRISGMTPAAVTAIQSYLAKK
ncbi:MAG: tRNA uridine-5-carboxymethylaminomethyl(34) synthesis enzyme MnmG [Thermosulfidibacteraceae bacterium]|jgi:tRNA uridine 5-carboxymethylaminomethyl modification enzyme